MQILQEVGLQSENDNKPKIMPRIMFGQNKSESSQTSDQENFIQYQKHPIDLEKINSKSNS